MGIQLAGAPGRVKRGRRSLVLPTVIGLIMWSLAIPAAAVDVEGDSDTTPPAIVSLLLDPTSVDVSSGSVDVLVTLGITDELSGFRDALVVFYSPSRGQFVNGWLSDSAEYWVSGDENDGAWQSTFVFPQFSEAGTWTLYVQLKDDVGNTRNLYEADLAALGLPSEFEVTENEPPVADAGGPYGVAEGTTATLDASGSSDPDDNIVSYEWDLDGDSLFDDAFGVSVSASFADDGQYIVGLRVTDDEGESDAATAMVTVTNVAPVLGSISGPLGPLPVGSDVTVSVPFTDVGVADTHIVSWSWGDGTSAEGTVNESAGSGTAFGTHVYATPGVYTVTVTVTDDDEGATSSAFEYVVVYDPSTGFITGGGWIYSEIGSCYLDDLCSAAEGKANFGFVAKYKKGADVPDGQTEFQFSAGGLDFHSSSYDWLVVPGNSTARFKGVGTINGSGVYKFHIWAQDGDPDTFRIKIWTEDEDGVETVAYDNGFNHALGGGSIVVHAK